MSQTKEASEVRTLQIDNREDFLSVIREPARYMAGFPIGNIAIDLVYPKLPGNVTDYTRECGERIDLFLPGLL